MSYLCLKGDSTSSPTATTVTQLVQFQAQSDIFNNVILPTFTVSTVGNHIVRCLLDTASQSSFITDDMAQRLALPVIELRLNVEVHGFNEAKTYALKMVSIDVIVDNKLVNVRALTIPKIRTDQYI